MNELKIYLGEEYTENPIVNFLLYSQKGNDTMPTERKLYNKEFDELTYEERCKYYDLRDKWRLQHDLDAMYLRNLYADTIFSIWTPLKMCLQISDTYPYSERGIREKPHKSYPYIPNIIKNIDTYLPYDKWEDLYKFVSIALTKANVMELPSRQMQGRIKFYDQMPKTLYECFEGGDFADCFKVISVRDWVISQDLTMFFENEISRENIKPLIPSMKASEIKWIKTREEVNQMLENFYTLLKERQAVLGKES